MARGSTCQQQALELRSSACFRHENMIGAGWLISKVVALTLDTTFVLEN
jgi:hypothetical protein